MAESKMTVGLQLSPWPCDGGQGLTPYIIEDGREVAHVRKVTIERDMDLKRKRGLIGYIATIELFVETIDVPANHPVIGAQPQ